MKITCVNCNGTFDNQEAACPYCGYINVAGAEREYMENLDEIIDDFDDVANHPKEQLKREAISTTKKTAKIFVVVIAIILALLVASWALLAFLNRPYETPEEQAAQLLWEKAMYPKLDELYDQGDYDAVLQIMDETYADKENDYYFGSWEHSQLMFKYSGYQFFQSAKERGAPYTDYEISTILINALEGKAPNFTEYLAKEDVALAQQYTTEQYEFLLSDLGYTEQELDALYTQAMESGYFSVEGLYKEGKEREAELYG